MEGYVNLTDTRCRFRLSGEDRVRYLNGQVTNQVERASAERSIQACVCTHKGKLDGVIYISADDTALRIDAPIELRDHLFARLAKYIIADDAELEDVTDETTMFHSFDTGEGAESNRFGISGRDIWDAVPAGDEISAQTLEQLRVEEVVPKWGAEMSHDTLPAEIKLQQTAVDFHKGCYLGQEVVSRIQSVGRVNRELVSLTPVDGTGNVTDRLFAADDDAREGKPLGQITSVAPDGAIALAIVRHTHLAPETELVSVGQDGNIIGKFLVRAR